MTDKERIQVLEERVTALERQLQGQPDMDAIFSEVEKRIILQMSRARGTSLEQL